jgi:3',5'-cyclic AMP phosphodiesterase CpdA
MALWAISDLHLDYPKNRELVAALPERPRDWLALAGDVGSRPEHLRWALGELRPRYAGVVWTPGNHDLWSRDGEARGEELYRELVEICRAHDVRTPEDPYPECEAGGERVVLAPVFCLYDYSFRPPGSTKEEAFERAIETGAFCRDERALHPDPYPSREEWCAARVAYTAPRLADATAGGLRTVIVTHFPLRRDVVRIPRIPAFAPWCGTELTAGWDRRFRAAAVVSGHLHVPGTMWRDGVPHLEVSLGYPRQWRGRPAWMRAPRQVAPGIPRAAQS